MNWPFRDKPDRIRRWMTAKGFSGSLYNATNDFFKSRNLVDKGSLYDNIRHRMNELGYTGTITDQLKAFFKDTNGRDGDDAERMFWNVLSNDF